MVEAIALGRFGIGAKSLPLGVIAGLTWVTAVLLLPVPEVSATSELRGAWRRTGTWARVGLGVTGGVGVAFTVWLLRHPSIGLDSNLYHYVEVSRWLHDGGIGGFERLDYGVSYSSYPLTNEVLLAWGAGIARSFAPLAVWMPFTLALAGAATWRGLRNLEVGLVATLLAVTALVTLPLAIRELNEPSNDVPALAWLACTGALCAAVPRRPGLMVPAIVAAGLALGSKTTTFVPLVACVGGGLWVLRGRLRLLVAPLGAAVVAALAVGWLWFVRDIVLYGSPLWPHVSVPWGEPKPRFFKLVAERFIERPAATLHGRVDLYLGRVAGGLLLVVAGLLAPLAGTRSAGRWSPWPGCSLWRSSPGRPRRSPVCRGRTVSPNPATSPSRGCATPSPPSSPRSWRWPWPRARAAEPPAPPRSCSRPPRCGTWSSWPSSARPTPRRCS